MRAAFMFLSAGIWLVSTVAAVPTGTSPVRDQPLNDFLSSVGVDRSSLPSNVRTLNTCVLACTILSAAYRDALVTPRSNATRYEQEAEAFWSASAHKEPTCLFTPRSIGALRTAVLTARFSRCQFAVRSGGHSPFPGFAGIDDGLLISMSGFTDIRYHQGTQVLRSGMGNRWGDIYAHLAPLGRIVVGGRLNDVGLGLATGGGLSHLSSAHGWVSQNVISYEVMLADGRHVKASATENPDLYHAVKAANNNFGIVTHINQRTYPMGKVWGGTVVYSGAYAEDFMAAMADYQQVGQLDTKSGILPYLAVTNDTILSTFVYFDDVVRPAAFAPFYEIPSIFDGTQVYDSFYDFANGDRDAYVGLVSVLSEFVARVQSVTSGTLALMAQPISQSMVDESLARGSDPMAVTAQAQLWAAINIGWSQESDDATVNEILVDCLAAVDAYAVAQGVFDSFRFINDASPHQQPLQSFGTQSYNSLRSASQRYDSSGLFQKLVPGGFKLS
ncbi:oxidase/Diels-Alderase [Sodiomyces alkalinus F11]|uniref:Oxidase/Diels-Alderase n=1 Tax=Sodiomyces alkalinus (strain CBS 110278 / VKM F-3762 / F11) TaxID=1314773 RepID=A0A3N2Q206_SODAK|nr:oxidase/Diels-Alderase [Sodiomyces alkalinus F11]ROT40790.1 oxidase/Diels-Alderase [Sodiomyces alkalinus F11]